MKEENKRKKKVVLALVILALSLAYLLYGEIYFIVQWIPALYRHYVSKVVHYFSIVACGFNVIFLSVLIYSFKFYERAFRNKEERIKKKVIFSLISAVDLFFWIQVIATFGEIAFRWVPILSENYFIHSGSFYVCFVLSCVVGLEIIALNLLIWFHDKWFPQREPGSLPAGKSVSGEIL